MDWLDLLAVQGTLKSLLQHHSSKASILRCSAFFIVQLSHPYMATGKTIALIIHIFVIKVMSLLLNMLSRFVLKSSVDIAFHYYLLLRRLLPLAFSASSDALDALDASLASYLSFMWSCSLNIFINVFSPCWPLSWFVYIIMMSWK